MKKNKKILIIAIVAALVIIAGIAGFAFNRVNANSNMKKFTIVVQSERDGLDKTLECKSDMATVGEYLRTVEGCQYEESDYGIYITGWFDCAQDLDNQYWWSFMVDNEMSPNGADLTELQDGHEYEFILVQGW